MSIQQIFQTHGEAYLKAFGDRMPVNHRKVIHAMQNCRAGGCGHHLFACECGQIHVAKSSCGNRHCPQCQHSKAINWVHQQELRKLPCTYFFATFTLPSELHEVARKHPREVYGALFDAAAGSLKTLEADPRFVGCNTSGFFGILHTWGRQLQYHPHVHFVIAGGGLDAQRTRWVPARGHFLVHVKALSKMFRGKLQQRLANLGLLSRTPGSVWQRNDWVVHCKSVGDGRHVLKYLGAYVFRVAISNSRVLEVTETHVTIAWKKVGSNRPRKLVLTLFEFMRRFLQHVLPKGFVKVRHYGFLSPNFGLSLDKIRGFICVLYQVIQELVPPPPPPVPFKPLCCSVCGAPMRWVRFFPPLRYRRRPSSRPPP